MGWFLLISRHQGIVSAVGATVAVVIGAAAIAAAIDALGIGVQQPDASANEGLLRADLPSWFVDASMPGLGVLGLLSVARMVAASATKITGGAAAKASGKPKKG